MVLTSSSPATREDVIKILILGGYGNAGRALVPLLLEYADPKVHLILSGRHVEKADAFVKELNEKFPNNNRVTTCFVDTKDPSSLRSAFDGVDVVLVASTTCHYAHNVVTAALDAKVDYFDIQVIKEKLEVLESIKEEIKNAGLCIITGGGVTPGTPAALVRRVAQDFGRLDTAHVGAWGYSDYNTMPNFSADALDEYITILCDSSLLMEYKKSQWKNVGLLSMRKFDFGEPVGKKECIPLYLPEMKEVTEIYPDLKDCGFYLAGTHWAIDMVIFPIILLTLKIAPKKGRAAMRRLLLWGLRTFLKPPFGEVVQVEASGIGENGELLKKTLKIYHPDDYVLTSIPVVSAILQYMDTANSIRKPGLWYQGTVIDPERLLKDMERMGVEIRPPLGD